MGLKLLSSTLGALVMVGVIDLFVVWYDGFLRRRMVSPRTRIMLNRLVWVMLALLFWGSLYRKGMPETFGPTYFLFFLFIYSVRGLIVAFIRPS